MKKVFAGKVCPRCRFVLKISDDILLATHWNGRYYIINLALTGCEGLCPVLGRIVLVADS